MYYPYSLYVMTVNTGTQDGNGDFAATAGAWSLVGECRDESNGAGRKVMLPDGTLYLFSSAIYLPAAPYALQPGQKIKVMDGSVQRLEGEIARISNDRKNSRIWV